MRRARQVEGPALLLVILKSKSIGNLRWRSEVIVRHHYDGRVYVIEVPDGSRVRRSEAAGESAIFVPTEGGGEVPIFEVPGELLVQLAERGRYGLRLVGVEEVPES